MADIVEALLHASAPGDEPRDVYSVDADSRGVVVGARELCLYGPPSDGGLRADGTYLIDGCPEVGDDDRELLPEAATAAGLEFLAMGEHLEDVRTICGSRERPRMWRRASKRSTTIWSTTFSSSSTVSMAHPM